MYTQVAKKTGLLLGTLTIAVAGFLGGYSDDTGLTIATPAEAQGYYYCVGQCVDYCLRQAWCIDYQGYQHGPFVGYHEECCY